MMLHYIALLMLVHGSFADVTAPSPWTFQGYSQCRDADHNSYEAIGTHGLWVATKDQCLSVIQQYFGTNQYLVGMESYGLYCNALFVAGHVGRSEGLIIPNHDDLVTTNPVLVAAWGNKHWWFDTWNREATSMTITSPAVSTPDTRTEKTWRCYSYQAPPVAAESYTYVVDCTTRTYADSVAYCASQGMTIASFHSDADVAMVGTPTCDAYLGGESTGAGYEWNWNDGSAWWQYSVNDGLDGISSTRLVWKSDGTGWHDWGHGGMTLGVICKSGSSSSSDDSYFSPGFDVAGCPPGQEITTVEECTTAIQSLGNAADTNPMTISYSGVPQGCTKHVLSTGLDQVYFNTASGNKHPNYAPVCKTPGPYYSPGFNEASCPSGQEITTVEECTIAIQSLGNAAPTGPMQISYWGVPSLCTKHVLSTGLDQVYFNTASGVPHPNYAPVCKTPGRRLLMDGEEASAFQNRLLEQESTKMF